MAARQGPPGSLGAPGSLTGYLAFMLASLAVLAAITLVWKISIHCAAAAFLAYAAIVA